MSNEQLLTQMCVPCTLGTPTLKQDEIDAYYKQLNPEWKVIEGIKLERVFKFKNFNQALEFVNKVGELAESEGHHPDIALGWGYVHVTLITHKIKGLSTNDFILASKIDQFA